MATFQLSGHLFAVAAWLRSEEHTSELQSQSNLVCRLLLEKKKEEHRRHRETEIPLLFLHTAVTLLLGALFLSQTVILPDSKVHRLPHALQTSLLVLSTVGG